MRESAGKVLMFVENNFPKDSRVKNEAYTLKREGYKVTVIALRGEGERVREEIDGVVTYRIPRLTLFRKKTLNRNSSKANNIFHYVKSMLGYVGEYCYFTSACMALSLYVLVREGFDVLHAHNPPDSLFLIGCIYKLFGKKFVFDHHDLCPELFLSRFRLKAGIIFWILLAIEWFSLRLADMVIATNESYREIEIKRGKLNRSKVFVVRNGPDLDRVKIVAPDEGLKGSGKVIIGYVGIMGPQDGVDYLLRALKHLVFEIGRKDFYCIIIGTGDSLEDLKEMAKEFNIGEHVCFTGYIPDEDMLRYLSTADICVDPDPSSPLNDESTWIKIMEYMALGKSIVSFDLKESRYTAQQAAIYVTPNDERQFARAIVSLMDNPAEREKMGAFGLKRVKKELAWQHVSKNLLSAYQSMCKGQVK